MEMDKAHGGFLRSSTAALLFAVALVCLSVCVVQSRALREKQTRIRLLQRNLQSIGQQHEAAVRVVAQLTLQLRQLHSDCALRMHEPGTFSIESPAANFPGQQSVRARVADWMVDPAAREAMRQQQRAAIDLLYGPLLREFAFSKKQTRRLQELLLERQLNLLEAAARIDRYAGLDAGQFTTKWSEQQQRFDRELSELLGPRHVTFQSYDAALSYRFDLEELSSQCAAASQPLSEAQIRALTEIIKAEREGDLQLVEVDASSTAVPEQITSAYHSQWLVNERIYDRSKSILTPNQLAQFGKFQTNQLGVQQAGMDVALKMLGNGRPSD